MFFGPSLLVTLVCKHEGGGIEAPRLDLKKMEAKQRKPKCYGITLEGR